MTWTVGSDMHGLSDEGTWLVYAPGSCSPSTGIPSATYGPFPNRAAADAFLEMTRGTIWAKVAVNLTDYPDWFGAGTRHLI